MFKNKSSIGKNNICGNKIRYLRKEQNLSQRALADLLQLESLDLTKNTIQKIENGERFVIDIELVVISKFFGITVDELLS